MCCPTPQERRNGTYPIAANRPGQGSAIGYKNTLVAPMGPNVIAQANAHEHLDVVQLDVVVQAEVRVHVVEVGGHDGAGRTGRMSIWAKEL